MASGRVQPLLYNAIRGGSVRSNMSLTARQSEILAFIAESQNHDGIVPSSREIQEHFGFASQTAAMIGES